MVMHLLLMLLCLGTLSKTESGPPIIDMDPLFSSQSSSKAEGRQQTLGAIIDALENHGLFLMTGESITAIVSRGFFAAANTLFSLPLESKMAVKQTDAAMRGYIPHGGESGLPGTIFELKEGFAYGSHTGQEDTNSVNRTYLGAPNQWPPGLQAHEIAALSSLYDSCSSLAAALLEALLPLLVPLESEHRARFQQYLSGGDISLMRAFRYFEQDSDQPSDAVLGSAPHTDWGLLTLIVQNGVGGLQYLPRDGGKDAWQDVPVVPDSIIVNAGDFLQILTREGRPVLSPIHRVVLPRERDRTSFVYFHYPAYDTQLPESAGDGGEPSVGKAEIAFNSGLGFSHGQDFGEFITNKWRGVSSR